MSRLFQSYQQSILCEYARIERRLNRIPRRYWHTKIGLLREMAKVSMGSDTIVTAGFEKSISIDEPLQPCSKSASFPISCDRQRSSPFCASCRTEPCTSGESVTQGLGWYDAAITNFYPARQLNGQRERAGSPFPQNRTLSVKRRIKHVSNVK